MTTNSSTWKNWPMTARISVVLGIAAAILVVAFFNAPRMFS